MEAAAKQIAEQGAQNILKIGRKFAVELSEQGTQAKGKDEVGRLMYEIATAAQQGYQDDFVMITERIANNKDINVGLLRQIRLRIQHFLKRALGRYQAAAEVVAEQGATGAIKSAKAADSASGGLPEITRIVLKDPSREGYGLIATRVDGHVKLRSGKIGETDLGTMLVERKVPLTREAFRSFADKFLV